MVMSGFSPAPSLRVPPNKRANLSQTATFEAVKETLFDGKRVAAAPTTRARRTIAALGDYQLLAKLGQGGMGTVYRARQLSQQREVALKVLARNLAGRPDLVERFERESQALFQLSHPHLVPCYDFGQAHGYHYLVMEYLDGGSVEAWRRKLLKFAPADALHLVLACARALEYAHGQGLIHRDVKPDNLLLSRTGMVKLADLGLARCADEGATLCRAGVGAGTPLYIAPEQARSLGDADERSDIYSLGCMLYLFLTGRYPFNSTNVLQLFQAKQKGVFLPLRHYEPDLPAPLERIVARMIDPQPWRRYPCCDALIADLESLQLAGPRLEFLARAGSVPSGQGKATHLRLPAFAHNRTQVPPPAPAKPANADVWYWSMRSLEGQVEVKELSPAKLTELLEEGILDARARVSRSARTGFRLLGSYAELRPLLKVRPVTPASPARENRSWLRSEVGQAILGVTTGLALVAGIALVLAWMNAP
jgi:serine/threonine-protein kinase